MPAPMKHSVFGDMVPDQWDDDLLTFRAFPYMRPFWYRDRDSALACLTSQHRQWVENWTSHIADLSPVCRNGDVYAALQSYGVYEVSVTVPEGDAGAPSDSQVAAYHHFNEHEERVCRNVAAALLRYYRVAREEAPAWFEDDGYPDDPTSEQFGAIVEFDGFCIARCSAGGISPLRFSWNVDWDPEHGLAMAVFQDEVLAIGSDDVDDFLNEPEEAESGCVWETKHMTAEERAMLRQYIEGFEPGEESDW